MLLNPSSPIHNMTTISEIQKSDRRFMKYPIFSTYCNNLKNAVKKRGRVWKLKTSIRCSISLTMSGPRWDEVIHPGMIVQPRNFWRLMLWESCTQKCHHAICVRLIKSTMIFLRKWFSIERGDWGQPGRVHWGRSGQGHWGQSWAVSSHVLSTDAPLLSVFITKYGRSISPSKLRRGRYLRNHKFWVSLFVLASAKPSIYLQQHSYIEQMHQ